tara:strand:- start:709 stop:1503 length:795 start_codon:yes stop_codon:yes gene_type:complete
MSDTFNNPSIFSLIYSGEEEEEKKKKIIEYLKKFPNAAFERDDDGSLPLYSATVINPLGPALVKLILDANPQAADEKNESGWFLLHSLVVIKADPRIVKLILGAHLEAAAERDKYGRFLLHIVAERNDNWKVVKCILNAHSSAATENDKDGQYPLHIAASNSNKEIVELIFCAHPKAATERDNNDMLPIHLVEKNNSELYRSNPGVEQFLLKATLRVIRWPSSAKVIQRAWRECRYNPKYKMCNKVQCINIKNDFPDLLEDLNQ